MSERTCSVDGCTRPHRARGFCSTCYNQRHQPNRHVTADVPCTVCGKPTIKRLDPRRRTVCSNECRWWTQFEDASCPIPESHAAHPCWNDRLLPVLYKAPTAVAKERARRRWVCGTCARCDAPYVAEDYSGTARFCSLACARAAGKEKRRALERDAYVADVNRIKVFERDCWICQLCRKKVDRNARVPHPKAATIDHRVPLAKGGTHEPANAQCAHYLCNSVKRDTMPAALQLMLFG